MCILTQYKYINWLILHIPNLNSAWLTWVRCEGVFPSHMTSVVFYSRMRGGWVWTAFMSWHDSQTRGKATSGCSFKAQQHESWETTACSPGLISPLHTSYRRPKQSFLCCGEAQTFISPLRDIWAGVHHWLPNSEHAAAVQASWVTPLSLCSQTEWSYL